MSDAQSGPSRPSQESFSLKSGRPVENEHEWRLVSFRSGAHHEALAVRRHIERRKDGSHRRDEETLAMANVEVSSFASAATAIMVLSRLMFKSSLPSRRHLGA